MPPTPGFYNIINNHGGGHPLAVTLFKPGAPLAVAPLREGDTHQVWKISSPNGFSPITSVADSFSAVPEGNRVVALPPQVPWKIMGGGNSYTIAHKDAQLYWDLKNVAPGQQVYLDPASAPNKFWELRRAKWITSNNARIIPSL